MFNKYGYCPLLSLNNPTPCKGGQCAWYWEVSPEEGGCMLYYLTWHLGTLYGLKMSEGFFKSRMEVKS